MYSCREFNSLQNKNFKIFLLFRVFVTIYWGFLKFGLEINRSIYFVLMAKSILLVYLFSVVLRDFLLILIKIGKIKGFKAELI